ncbi:MAG: polysaccharide biosynthesis/export family protein, partial [Candidatus Udaeobacter sp.]
MSAHKSTANKAAEHCHFSTNFIPGFPMRYLTFFFLLWSIPTLLCAGQSTKEERGYTLAPGDGITVHVLDVAELDSKALGVLKVDHQGNVNLPLAGRIQASGLTVEKLEQEISKRLSSIMNSPDVTVAVAEYRSHPVSVLGAVRSPGVYQV